MEQLNIEAIRCGPPEECLVVLKEFITKHEKDKFFPDISSSKKKELWDVLFSRIQSPTTSPELIGILLNVMRLLSREKATLEDAMNDARVETILKLSSLKDASEKFHNCGHDEALEALKVLFNMIFQSQVLQTMFINNDLLSCLTNQVRFFTQSSYPTEVQYFTLRVFFMITALCQETGRTIRNELRGITPLVEFAQQKLQSAEPIDDTTADLICECFKVLYNLIHDIVPNKTDPGAHIEDDEDRVNVMKVAKLVRRALVCPVASPEKMHEVHSHSIDLLAAVPTQCYEEIITLAEPEAHFVYENYDVSAPEAIAVFLDERLDKVQTSSGRVITELLSPTLSVMLRMSGGHRVLRKYFKQRILPPLKKTDVMERPEVGVKIRNKLCALLTSPATNVTDLVANLLFILCKENVSKMVKYTGYGNAAGLLANRGLLLGGRGNSKEYSSDSDSDTEEYKEVEHLINDVEGRIQPERSNPCEGMTEEQKEHEAVKLVNAIDRLQRAGTITPCGVGPDGKPKPLEHVTQLSEALVNNLDRSRRNDSDSDSDV